MRELQTRFPNGKVVRERYVVEELLGQGGFGAVYRVHDRRVKGNVFALKEIVHPNKHQRECFVFEGEVLKRLDHHALPRVYRVFEDAKHNRLCMLMDYIEGPNLEKLRLRQSAKRFSVSQVLQLLTPIIEAVVYLHAQQPPILHRDIKPSNIIIPDSGEGSVLVDFGIAKEYDTDSTTTAIRHCSPGYGAPEQYIRDTSTRTDIYGLAATCYTLLTGEVPIDALYRITRLSGGRPDPLVPVHELEHSLPSELSSILHKAMAVNSNDRYASVQEFWHAFSAEAVEAIALEPIREEPEPLLDDDIERIVSEIAAEPTAQTPHTPDPHVPVTTGLHERQASYNTSRYTYGFIALAVLALIVGVTFGTTTWSGARRALLQQTPVATSSAQAMKPSPTTTATSLKETPAPTKPAARPKPRSSLPPVTLPFLAVSYSGAIYNTPASVNSTMYITQVQQHQGAISGYFSVGPGLIGNGSFTGIVTTDNHIQFLVPSQGSILPLFFVGQVNADGVISGTYCSYREDHCDYSGGGYGNWSVTPTPITHQ